jgi:parvulin-like peptidyl-prolyl cis-trans isomerase-like protein
MQRFTVCACLLLVAAGCKTGGQSADFPVPPPPAASDSTDKVNLVVAEVAGLKITGADLKNHMAEKSGSDENLQRYLNNPDILQVGLASLVDQLTWGEMAKRAGMKLTHEEAMKVRSLEAQLLATRYVADVVQMRAVPSEKDIEEFYKMNQERYLMPARVAVRHILVPTQAEAENLLAKARGGADFGALAKQYSQDPNTKDIGGALGYVESQKPILGIGNDPDFQQAVLPLQVGDVTVTKSRLGWHVIKAEKREGGGLVPLSQVHDEISKNLTSRDFSRVYNEALTEARKQVEARYVTENFDRFSGVADNPGRLFQIAKSQTDPLSQIELFRRVAFDFPDSHPAAEAQFMMGYLYLTAFNQKSEAASAFKRLQEVFPSSVWRKGGDYMLKHLDDQDPKELGSPREILAKAQQS